MLLSQWVAISGWKNPRCKYKEWTWPPKNSRWGRKLFYFLSPKSNSMFFFLSVRYPDFIRLAARLKRNYHGRRKARGYARL